MYYDIFTLISRIRAESVAPAVGGYTTDASILALIQSVHEDIYTWLRENAREYHNVYSDALTSVAQQEEYTLPDNVLDRAIVKVEYRSGSGSSLQTSTYIPSTFEDRPDWGSFAHGGIYNNSRRVFMLRGRNIIFYPRFGTTGDTIRIYYLDYPVPLHGGTATAGGANTITFPANATLDDASTVSTLIFPPATYVGQIIRIVDGTAVGNQRVITNYNSSTRVATVDSNWSVATDATSKYSLMPKLPEEYLHDIFVYSVADRLYARQCNVDGVAIFNSRSMRALQRMVTSIIPRVTGFVGIKNIW